MKVIETLLGADFSEKLQKGEIKEEQIPTLIQEHFQRVFEQNNAQSAKEQAEQIAKTKLAELQAQREKQVEQSLNTAKIELKGKTHEERMRELFEAQRKQGTESNPNPNNEDVSKYIQELNQTRQELQATLLKVSEYETTHIPKSEYDKFLFEAKKSNIVSDFIGKQKEAIRNDVPTEIVRSEIEKTLSEYDLVLEGDTVAVHEKGKKGIKAIASGQILTIDTLLQNALNKAAWLKKAEPTQRQIATGAYSNNVSGGASKSREDMLKDLAQNLKI